MATLTVKDLLLAPRLDPHQVTALLSPYGLRDFDKADANLQAAAGNPAERHMLAGLLEELLKYVSRAADPDRSLTCFERFAQAALNKAQLFSYLANSAQALEILARVLGGSPYMAEILIRDPHHFYWVTDPQILRRARGKREIQHELVRTLKMLPEERQQLDYLRSVKRREMLHIGVRDLLRLSTVEETLAALSDLAEALITTTFGICAMALRREYSLPGRTFTRFTILAMGKLGGAELNFSSDVDLMYLYGSEAERVGGISAPDFFHKLAQRITGGLNELTGEGYIYRVDLRLRPEGEAGHLVYPLAAFERYYQSRMAPWERLALLKASPVAGDRALGREFLTMAQSFIFGAPFGSAALEDVRSMKRKIDQKMTARRQRDRNVKLGTGGIREIELIVQLLQIRHGAASSQGWDRNTLKAIDGLSAKAALTAEEREALAGAYLFLRDVENKLQMVNDAQTHSLPEEQEELVTCARLLGYSALEEFQRDYHYHTAQVNRIFEDIVGTGGSSRFLGG